MYKLFRLFAVDLVVCIRNSCTILKTINYASVDEHGEEAIELCCEQTVGLRVVEMQLGGNGDGQTAWVGGGNLQNGALDGNEPAVALLDGEVDAGHVVALKDGGLASEEK